MAVVFLLIYPAKIHWITACLLMSVAIGLYCNRVGFSSSSAMILVSLPVILLGFEFGFSGHDLKTTYRAKVLFLIFVISFSWLNDLPHSPDKIYFLVPEESGEYEDKFFKNYKQIIKQIKPSSEVILRPDTVKAGSMVVVPRLTRKLLDDLGWNAFSEYAKENRLVVLIAGEHTNYKGVAERANMLTTGLSINNDLTVPPNNTDEAGHLRSSTLSPFPFNAILNRGASVGVQSIFAKVLLSGDGWFVDPDFGDSTWVGDFLLDPGEKRGRITIGASYNDGARWVFIGDNSFLLNTSLISDPKPLASAISFSTLWPIFISDLTIVLFFLFLLPVRYSVTSAKNVGFLCCFLSVVLTYGVVATMTAKHLSPTFFKTTYLGESPFNPRNFSDAFVELLGEEYINDVQVFRHKKYIPEHQVGVGKKPEIHFGLINNELKIGDTRFFNCWRLGSLNLSSGIRINDGQSCNVEGSGQVLIGNRNDAAAVKLFVNKKPAIIILDLAFLSNGSLNQNNLKWIMGQIKSLTVETHIN